MLAQLRLAEEELQSDLERKTEAYETLKNANHKLQEDNFRMAKSLEVLKRELKTCEDALLHEFKLKEDTEFQVSCMQKQWHRLLNLERALNQKESSLHSKSIEIKAAHQANEMLAREYDYLQQEYQSLSQDHIELQIRLMGLEKQISLVEKPPKCDRSFQQAEILNSDIIQPKRLTQGRSIRTRTEDPSLPFKSIVAGCSTHHEDRTKRTQLKEPGLNGVLPSSVYPSCSTRARSSIASTADENGKASHQHVDRAFTSNLVKKSDAIPNLSSDPLKTWPEASSVAENHLHVIDTEQDTRNTNQFKQPSCLAARMPNICSEVYETNVGHDTNSASYDDFLEAKVNSKDKGDDVKSSASLELQKIQEEIQNREKSWKQTEAKMRAELSRRMSQLHEAEQEYQPFCAKESLPTRSFLRRNATKR